MRVCFRKSTAILPPLFKTLIFSRSISKIFFFKFLQFSLSRQFKEPSGFSVDIVMLFDVISTHMFCLCCVTVLNLLTVSAA